jgi:hypothetical protein
MFPPFPGRSRRLSAALFGFLLLLVTIVQWSSIVVEAKSSAEAHFDRAKSLIIQGKQSEAVLALEEAVNVSPEDYLMRFKRAGLLPFLINRKQTICYLLYYSLYYS